MKKLILLLLAIGAFIVVPASASADAYAGPFPNTTCWLYAQTPHGGMVAGFENVFTPGQLYNCHNISIMRETIWGLVSSGWQIEGQSQWTNWQPAPLNYETNGQCVPGRWYATGIEGKVQVTPNGVAETMSVNTKNSGWQCP